MNHRGLKLLILLTVLGGGAAARAGVRETGSWIAACDNMRTCHAYGLSDRHSGPTGDQRAAYLRITVAGEQGARPKIEIVLPGGYLDSAAVSVDGRPVEGIKPVTWVSYRGSMTWGTTAHTLGTVDPASVSLLLQAMRHGRKLEVGPLAFSLDGAETLAWIDAEQGRAGSVSALWAVGDRAESVPPLPPMPEIVLAPRADQAGLDWRMPASVLERTGTAGCPPNPASDISRRLAPGVVLWSPYCERHMPRQLFLGGEHGEGLRPVDLPLPADYDLKVEPLQLGAPSPGIPTDAGSWDADPRELYTFPWGSFCGRALTWKWGGQGFVLYGDWLILDCHGIMEEHRLPLFVATVKDPTPAPRDPRLGPAPPKS